MTEGGFAYATLMQKGELSLGGEICQELLLLVEKRYDWLTFARDPMQFLRHVSTWY